jgi:hypothetical protein
VHDAEDRREPHTPQGVYVRLDGDPKGVLSGSCRVLEARTRPGNSNLQVGERAGCLVEGSCRTIDGDMGAASSTDCFTALGGPSFTVSASLTG